MEPKVSVIIPVYNTEPYLAECLDSICSQTLREIEIIVINDASPDGSLEIIRRFMASDPRIVLIDKQKNEGVGKARNDGIAKASGEFVIFMDSDDLYPDATVLEKLYQAAVADSVQIVCGLREDLHEDGTIDPAADTITEYGLTFQHNKVTKYADFQYDYGYQCYLFSRELLQSNGIDFPLLSRFQDPPFFVRAMFAAGEYRCVGEPVYRYRLLPSAAKCAMPKTLDLLTGLEQNLRFSRENDLAKLHCLTAHRLDREASYMAAQNLYAPDSAILLRRLIEVTHLVDTNWLKESGYPLTEPFVPEVFRYAIDTAAKYEKLRNHRLIRILRKTRRKA